MLKSAHSALVAQGLQVQIPGMDLHTAHEAMLWRHPTYKKKKQRKIGTDVSSGPIVLLKKKVPSGLTAVWRKNCRGKLCRGQQSC